MKKELDVVTNTPPNPSDFPDLDIALFARAVIAAMERNGVLNGSR